MKVAEVTEKVVSLNRQEVTALVEALSKVSNTLYMEKMLVMSSVIEPWRDKLSSVLDEMGD